MHIRCSSLLSLIGVCLGGCLGSEFGSTLHAQAAFLTTPEAYLGQTPPSYTPKIFAPGLLADDGAETGYERGEHFKHESNFVQA